MYKEIGAEPAFYFSSAYIPHKQSTKVKRPSFFLRIDARRICCVHKALACRLQSEAFDFLIGCRKSEYKLGHQLEEGGNLPSPC